MPGDGRGRRDGASHEEPDRVLPPPNLRELSGLEPPHSGHPPQRHGNDGDPGGPREQNAREPAEPGHRAHKNHHCKGIDNERRGADHHAHHEVRDRAGPLHDERKHQGCGGDRRGSSEDPCQPLGPHHLADERTDSDKGTADREAERYLTPGDVHCGSRRASPTLGGISRARCGESAARHPARSYAADLRRGFLPRDAFLALAEPRGAGGTVAPLRRACDRPIAMACFLLLTLWRALPLCCAPRLYLRITRPTSVCARLPYFAIRVLPYPACTAHHAGFTRLERHRVL